MIHAFNFTCARDLDLSLLMVSTFNKHCPTGSISVTNTDVSEHYKGYGNGSGWQASMMKLKALSDVVRTKDVQNDDYVLSVDSDVVFTSPEIFTHIKDHGIIGTKHIPEFRTLRGLWSHMSGAAIFIRGDFARAMAVMNEAELHHIRFGHFKKFNLTENEDVVLSYLASYTGADQKDIGGLGLSSGNFEGDVAYVKGALDTDGMAGSTGPSSVMKSFYHLNYCPTKFLGEPVRGKWDIPSVLKKKGIDFI